MIEPLPCEVMLPGDDTEWRTAVITAVNPTTVRVWDGAGFISIHEANKPFNLRWVGSPRVTPSIPMN